MVIEEVYRTVEGTYQDTRVAHAYKTDVYVRKTIPLTRPTLVITGVICHKNMDMLLACHKVISLSHTSLML